jgi:CheY-like chemotaxis protein
MAAMLSLAGCQPLLAATGRDALTLCDRQPGCLAAVILDLHLPGEDTAALFAALRTRRPDLPIILTSGVSEAAARQRLGRSDVAGFLPKPFWMEHLLKTVEGALEPLPAPVDPPAPPPEIGESRDNPALHSFSEDAPPTAESFECWFPRRVAEAVRRGEVPEEVLRWLRTMLNAGGDAAAELPRHAAVCEIADLAGIPPEQAVAVFEALQQLPGVAQEQLARRIAEAWLERQRSQYRSGEPGG